jgi:hypothetical protein
LFGGDVFAGGAVEEDGEVGGADGVVVVEIGVFATCGDSSGRGHAGLEEGVVVEVDVGVAVEVGAYGFDGERDGEGEGGVKGLG